MNIYINGRFLSQKITGVQRYAIELVIRLKSINRNILILCPKNIVHKELAVKLGVKIIGKNTGHIWEQFDLPFYLKRNGNPLLLSLCNTSPLFYTNAVITIHDLAFLENPSWFSNSFYQSYKFLLPKISKKAKRIFTVSEFSKSEIINKLKANAPIDVIYNGFNPDFVIESKRIIKNDPYILFVGSIDPRKNLIRLIEAMRLVPKNIRLVIVGGNNKSFRNKYCKIEDSDRIHFTGYISEKKLATFYKNAVMFVYPSLYEGFGIPPLEAQAFGIPIVVSDINVFKEVFNDSAIYCDPYKIESISSAICRILEYQKSERERLVRKGFQNVKRFSWDDSAYKINAILKELL